MINENPKLCDNLHRSALRLNLIVNIHRSENSFPIYFDDDSSTEEPL